MSDDIEKSNSIKPVIRGERVSTYDSTANIQRKLKNVGDQVGAGPNVNVKSYSSKAGQLTAKQQAAFENSKRRVKALSGPVKVYTDEEKKKLQATMGKDEDFVEETADGKKEIVEGKEPLKKDPKARWASLKKTIHHSSAFLNLDEELKPEPDEQAEAAPPEQGEAPQAPEDAATPEHQKHLKQQKQKKHNRVKNSQRLIQESNQTRKNRVAMSHSKQCQKVEKTHQKIAVARTPIQKS
jgi:hypothetical protein